MVVFSHCAMSHQDNSDHLDVTGDLNLQTEHEAAMVQTSLENCLGNNLSFRLQPGDLVINEFETLAWLSGRKLRRRNTSRWVAY